MFKVRDFIDSKVVAEELMNWGVSNDALVCNTTDGVLNKVISYPDL